MKRLFDLAIAVPILLCALPLLGFAALAIWLQDFKNPLYVASRVGKGGGRFKMYKLRSMVANADRSGVDSTAANDHRITPVGMLVRKFKLDELAQLLNVVVGEMSLVGPRPNVPRDVALYTDVEMRLLAVRPGITDLASIVFSDEGDILKGSRDPDLDYNQLIRPWKSRLALWTMDHHSLGMDFKLVILTAVAVVSRGAALRGVQRLLESRGGPMELIRMAGRSEKLSPHPPPGADRVVQSREGSATAATHTQRRGHAHIV